MSNSRPVLLWVLAYSVCSTAMLLANKAALNTYPLPFALTCVQLIFAATVTLPLVIRGGFTRISAKSLPLYVFEGILFAASISLNLKALNMTNVGMMVIQTLNSKSKSKSKSKSIQNQLKSFGPSCAT